jgi:hypothetical protein
MVGLLAHTGVQKFSTPDAPAHLSIIQIVGYPTRAITDMPGPDALAAFIATCQKKSPVPRGQKGIFMPASALLQAPVAA